MTIIEKIRAEIERRFREYNKDSNHHLQAAEDADLLSFLDTLESEKPMNQDGLEKEYEDYVVKDPCFSKLVNRNAGLVIARHFAQWGAEHLAEARKTLEIKPGDEVTINGHKIVYDKDKGYVTIVKSEESVPNDLEEAAENYIAPIENNEGLDYINFNGRDIKDAFIAGANWQKQHDAELIEIAYNDGITIGMTKQKEQMMKDYPKWRRIKAGERLPCPAYVWTIAYDNYPDCFEGRLMPNIEGVKIGRDTWYLPVDVIHNLPKED